MKNVENVESEEEPTMCYHIIAPANLHNLTNFKDAAMKIRLGPKQGRGRRQKMRFSLNKPKATQVSLTQVKPKAAKAKPARNATNSRNK